LYLNDGEKYFDVTQVSGADMETDGRSFAIFDFDNDGWQDIALMSTNSPRFRLLKNSLGDGSKNKRLVIKLVGAATSSEPNSGVSNRDGIGARLLVEYESGRKLMKHRQSGEGNVAQNSSLVWIGIAADDQVRSIKVLWPSGKTSKLNDFAGKDFIIVAEPK